MLIPAFIMPAIQTRRRRMTVGNSGIRIVLMPMILIGGGGGRQRHVGRNNCLQSRRVHRLDGESAAHLLFFQKQLFQGGKFGFQIFHFPFQGIVFVFQFFRPLITKFVKGATIGATTFCGQIIFLTALVILWVLNKKKRF